MRTNKKTFGTGTKISAVGTSLASVVRADFNHIDSFLQSLIFDKTLQLVEVPAVKPEVKLLSLSLLPYSSDVFHHDSSSFATGNNLFADVVVCPSFETSLLSRNPLEEFSGTSSAFGLEICPQTLILNHLAFDFLAAEELPIACYGNVVYSDINTQLKSVRNRLGIDISGKCDMQEHPLILIDGKESSLRTPIKILPITFGNFDWNINPAFDGCEPDPIRVESEGSFIKSQGHIFLKDRFTSFVSLDRFEGLGSYTISIYHKLRRNAKLLSNLVIAKMMELIPIVNTRLKSSVSDVRNSLAVLFHSFEKQPVHRDFKLNRSNRLHTFLREERVFKLIGDEKGQFLPTLKCRVSLPQTL